MSGQELYEKMILENKVKTFVPWTELSRLAQESFVTIAMAQARKRRS